MINFEKYSNAGAKKIAKHQRYALRVSDMQMLLDLVNEQGVIMAIEKAFKAGVEAGARIERKEAEARALDK